jgi:hypothetical protein
MSARRRPISHDEAVHLAVAASGLAGHDVSDEDLELLARIGRGEITHDEAVAEIIAQYAEPE